MFSQTIFLSFRGKVLCCCERQNDVTEKMAFKPWGLGCLILQLFNFSMLPKHFLIQFDERIPKKPKKVILDDVLGSQIAVKVSVLYANSNHAPNFFEANFSHLKEHLMTSGHHKTTLDIWIDHYGQKKIIKIAWFWWKLWLFCKSRNTEIFSPSGFHGFSPFSHSKS